jgi:exodeoxyribonuclease VII small subunit
MEKGGLNLEKSLELFAKGVSLTKECQKALKTAEQKVKILTENNLKDLEIIADDENNK